MLCDTLAASYKGLIFDDDGTPMEILSANLQPASEGLKRERRVSMRTVRLNYALPPHGSVSPAKLRQTA